MTAVTEPKKKTAKKTASTVEKMVAIGEGPKTMVDAPTGTHLDGEIKVANPPPVKKKPGAEGFDWQSEYPDEEFFVYTSPNGVTIGLTKLGPNRKPKPGVLRRVNAESREAGNAFPVLWYFLELASSPASLKAQELLEDDEYADMLKQWTEFAGIDLGE